MSPPPGPVAVRERLGLHPASHFPDGPAVRRQLGDHAFANTSPFAPIITISRPGLVSPSFAPLPPSPSPALQVGSPFLISVGGCKDFDMGAVFDTSSTLAGDTTAQRAAFQAGYAASRKCSFASPHGFGSAYKFAK